MSLRNAGTSNPSMKSYPGQLDELIKLWMLRALVPLGAHKEFVSRHGFDEDAIAEFLGMEAWIDPEDFEFCPKTVRNELRIQHELAEKHASKIRLPKSFSKNIERLAELVSLSDTDCRILEFLVLIEIDSMLGDTTSWLGDLTTLKTYNVLSVLLSIPEAKIRESVNPKGSLARSGLVNVDRDGTRRLDRKFDLLSGSFADNIISVDADPIDLLKDTLHPSPAPKLCINDYQYLTKELGVLMPYLKRSLEHSRKGVNVFIYGDPGTGKSQLMRVLAHELSAELFEVASEDSDGDPISGSKRLTAFRAGQSFLAKKKSLILFDEVEDVFSDGNGLWGTKSTAQTHKAWLNNMLEENPVPTFWLSNSVYDLDPAFIRRFDMVFELPVPNRKQRERIIKSECGTILDQGTISRISGSEMLAPAVVARASSVVSSIQEDLGENVSSAFELIVNNTLETQGHKRIPKLDPNGLPNNYDPDFINVNQNLEKILEGLHKTSSGRLCLYGPPGTGKTAYGRWLADQMGIPLLVKRGSDLISMWVGGTEKNIAHAFREAENEGALLLIDEVDSFLQDRRGAERSWEVTGVNEMLTQMESFSGVFIASTNLVDGLDQAALRRFDLKLHFDFMTSEQAWRLFASSCANFGLSEPEMSLKDDVAGLRNVTPGDFSALSRRHRFSPFETADDLFKALREECTLKEGPKRSIGFG